MAPHSSYAADLLSRYKTRGAVIDTTLLLLLIIGDYDLARIGSGRVQKYDVSDYRLMAQIVDFLSHIIVTPNILTEVDNLARQEARDAARFAAAVRSRWAKVSEVYKPSADAVRSHNYETVGLTDAHVLTLAAEKHLIITDDLPLYHRLTTARHAAININHIRTLF